MSGDAAATSRGTLVLVGLYSVATLGLVLGASRPEGIPVFIASAMAMLVIQIRWWQTDVLDLKAIAVLAVIVRVMALPVPPVLSDDVFRYIWDGMMNLEGLNPFLLVPSHPALASLQESTVYALINRPDVHTVYPPVSQAVFTAAAALGGDSWMRAFLALKTIMVILELIGLYMLSRIVKRRSVMLLALSPTLVVAGALSGHTDILLVALFGAALWTWRRDRAGSTVVLLTLAGWVKLWPLLFVVVFCVHVARRQPLMALKYAAGSVATTLLLWIPFMHMDVPGNILGSLELYVRWFEFNAGPYFVVKEWYWWTTGMDWSKKIGPAFRMAFLIGTAAIWLMQSIAPRRLAFVVSDPKNQPWLLCWVIACAYFLLSTTIHPWYVVGLVVMGIVLFEDRIPWHIVVFSVLSFGTYVLYVDGPYWWSVGLSWSIPGVVWIWLQVSGRRTGWMDRLLRWRAWSKMQMMRPWIVPGRGRVLDLGGAEGYVAEAILDRYPAWSAATIAETRAAVRTNHEYVVYDGFVLPMPDDSYGLVIASYVLHHADDADRVLSEALRVSTGRVVVLESVYGSALERVWLEWADRFANALRSRGEMGGRNDRLDHRRQDAWIRAAREQGGSVVAQRTVVRPGHTTAVLVLERLHGEPGDPGNL